jgi:hypothetical protein
MSQVNTKAIRTALYQKLNTASVTSLLASGSASLFHEIAPGTAAYPLVIFGKQSGVATKRFGGNALDSQLWLVKGIVRGQSSSVAEDIANAVSDLLDFGTLTISGGSLMHMARESDVDYTETNNDQQFRHHGALYRLVVQT